MKKNLFGSWAFLIGVILAVVVGIFTGLEIADLNKNNRFELPRLDTNDLPKSSK